MMQGTSDGKTSDSDRFAAANAGEPSEKLEARSARAVFDSHLILRLQNNVDQDIATNYSRDVVLMSCAGVLHGHEGVRASARRLNERLTEARFTYVLRMVEGDVAFLEWIAESRSGKVRDGADTFLIREAKIVAQTIHYSVAE